MSHATHTTPVAIAYVMQKTPYVFPIIGGRKVEHLMANIEALSFALSDEHIKYLESILPFDIGFPGNLIVRVHFYVGTSQGLTSRSRGTDITTICSCNSPASNLRSGRHSRLFGQQRSRFCNVKGNSRNYSSSVSCLYLPSQ